MRETGSYKRLLLKISGEALAGDKKFGIEPKALEETADMIASIHQEGYELGVVFGGGNLFRGRELTPLELDRVPRDHIGMLSTLINGVALQNKLTQKGIKTKALSAIDCPKVMESFTNDLAEEALSQGKVALFVGGTGNPYFTTDTAAALRASEIRADCLMKATKVDGVYTKDPLKYNDAKRYEEISYREMLNEKLEIMDATSVALLRTNQIPLFVFNMQLLKKMKVQQILSDKRLGTLVKGD